MSHNSFNVWIWSKSVWRSVSCSLSYVKQKIRAPCKAWTCDLKFAWSSTTHIEDMRLALLPAELMRRWLSKNLSCHRAERQFKVKKKQEKSIYLHVNWTWASGIDFQAGNRLLAVAFVMSESPTTKTRSNNGEYLVHDEIWEKSIHEQLMTIFLYFLKAIWITYKPSVCTSRPASTSAWRRL